MSSGYGQRVLRPTELTFPVGFISLPPHGLPALILHPATNVRSRNTLPLLMDAGPEERVQGVAVRLRFQPAEDRSQHSEADVM
jgi:hypothetical protein